MHDYPYTDNSDLANYEPVIITIYGWVEDRTSTTRIGAIKALRSMVAMDVDNMDSSQLSLKDAKDFVDDLAKGNAKVTITVNQSESNFVKEALKAMGFILDKSVFHTVHLVHHVKRG